MLLDTVRKTIKKNKLIENGDTVVCAVSGGADSICLLRVILSLKKEYNLSVYVANVNHLIRGEESDRDSSFVKAVCRAADVKCFYREYDVRKISKERKIGDEECGRILRYEFFQEVADLLGGAKIATAHNLNDNAETVIFRMARGSSAQGLSGISYKRDNIIRPLLDVSREKIEKYLLANSIKWCEDSTNKECIYTRNKIRLLVMPLLKEISACADEKIVNAAQMVSDDNEYLNEVAYNESKKCVFDEYLLIDKLLNLPLPLQRRITANILTKWGAQEITYDKIESFLEFITKDSGKQFDINSDLFAVKEYQRVNLCKREEANDFSATLRIGETISHDIWTLTAEIANYPVKRKNNDIAVFDADKLSPPFKVRYRKAGDKISLKGMKGTKKLSDVFSDAKIEYHLRNTIPIVEKNTEILYIGGLRQSSLYETDISTKRYLIIKYTQKKGKC